MWVQLSILTTCLHHIYVTVPSEPINVTFTWLDPVLKVQWCHPSKPCGRDLTFKVSYVQKYQSQQEYYNLTYNGKNSKDYVYEVGETYKTFKLACTITLLSENFVTSLTVEPKSVDPPLKHILRASTEFIN